MKILVTGGAGFIGSHLCRRLINEGNSVVCMDNLYTGSLENVSDLVDSGRFEFVHQDITTAIELEGIERIFNLACPASPVHYQSHPVDTIKTNTVGVMNVLELARRSGARVLQASTSEVYGDPEIHPQVESYWGNVNPIGIRSCYDEGKRIAETLFFEYHRQYGTEIKVARIFNTYGPNMQLDDGRVISNFIVQALRGEDITVYGSGNQTRSFCYVSDQVDGLMRLMDSDKSVTGPINIGNPQERTILELAEAVIKATGSGSELVYRELPSDDPKKRKPDITKARALLGWEPKVDLEEGLANTIEFFRGKV